VSLPRAEQRMEMAFEQCKKGRKAEVDETVLQGNKNYTLIPI
jgi:hypothetical protein